MNVYFRTFETADTVIAIVCGSRSLRVKFINAVGLTDPGLETVYDSDLVEHYDDVLKLKIEAVMHSKPSAAWFDPRTRWACLCRW